MVKKEDTFTMGFFVWRIIDLSKKKLDQYTQAATLWLDD